jgi:hypothetical protein
MVDTCISANGYNQPFVVVGPKCLQNDLTDFAMESPNLTNSTLTPVATRLYCDNLFDGIFTEDPVILRVQKNVASVTQC